MEYEHCIYLLKKLKLHCSLLQIKPHESSIMILECVKQPISILFVPLGTIEIPLENFKSIIHFKILFLKC